jgi:prepilin-type processing-associated H-X9-DG protein
MTSSYGYSDWLDWSGSGNCPKNIKQIPEPARTPAIVDCDNYRFLRPSWDGWQVWFYPIPRHNQRLNVLWLDGHASLITTNELETSPYWGQIFIQCQ